MLALTGVSKRYEGGLTALSGVDLAIPPESFTSVLGPSGCGKSTLLRLIAGLAEPDDGKIVGRPEGEIGLVFQDPTLMPWADVEANVYLPLRLAGMTHEAAKGRIREALALVGLSDFAGAFPRALSGGMRMRVSIARAIVTKPRLLLMDEPFAALDEITRAKLNDDLLALWRERRFTVVFVTHSVFETVYLSTDIAVMTARPGRIFVHRESGGSYPRPAEYRTSPEYTARCRAISADLEDAMMVTA